eukprot:Gb_07704 [translate_table: standard]
MATWEQKMEIKDGFQGNSASKSVCITGSWSFLSIWIAKVLLKKGYSVRFTVTVTTDEAGSLMDCEEAVSGRLVFAEVDLLDYRGVFNHISGCIGVFHVAAPCDLNEVQDYPADSIEYEVRGALNVVEACAAAETVRRVVFTSSVSAIVCDGHKSLSAGQILDEKSWTNLEFCREHKLWSPLTKTLSEKAVWALSKDRGLDLVVVNPALVVGPQQSTDNSQTLLNQFKGSVALQQNGVCAYIEVEEAALAHVAAFECENAAGRYICLERVLTEEEMKEVEWSVHQTSAMRAGEWKHSLNLSNEKFLKLKRQYSGIDAAVIA